VEEIHVLCVSLHGATPPPWRLLEVPSAMTLDRLHELLQRMFGWYGLCPHSFVTIYGWCFVQQWLAETAAHVRDE
jgi:hypothetical protein